MSSDEKKKEKKESSQTSDDSSSNKSSESAELGDRARRDSTQEQPPVKSSAVTRPRIGTPVIEGKTTTAPASEVQRTKLGSSAIRPQIGKPIGSQNPATLNTDSTRSVQQHEGQEAGAQPRTAVQRPRIGTPIGTNRQSIGQSRAAGPGAPEPKTVTSSKGSIRPPVSSPSPSVVTKPTVPAPKRAERKEDLSRRKFLQAIAIAGGLLAVAQFALPIDSYLQGSVGVTPTSKQVILDSITNQPIKTSDIPSNSWRTFVYPRTGNPNIDSDTFRQCVVVHLPKSFTAPSNLSAKDPISGDLFVGLSRVCVHLWCLWSYVPNDERAECPCHGSQYVPGSGLYPNFPKASNKPVGYAVAGPASLQTPPNNILPVIKLSAANDGTISATGIVGQIGCGQLC